MPGEIEPAINSNQHEMRTISYILPCTTQCIRHAYSPLLLLFGFRNKEDQKSKIVHNVYYTAQYISTSFKDLHRIQFQQNSSEQTAQLQRLIGVKLEIIDIFRQNEQFIHKANHSDYTKSFEPRHSIYQFS